MWRRETVLCVGVIGSAALTSSIQGSVTWVQTSSGSWHVGSNWSSGRVPPPSEVAFFNLNQALPHSVVIDAPAAILRIDIGKDIVLLDGLGSGTLSATANPSVRVGVGAQPSKLFLKDVALSTGSIQLGVVSGSAELQSSASTWDIAGQITCGLNGSSASVHVLDGSDIEASGALNYATLASPCFIRVAKPGSRLAVGGVTVFASAAHRLIVNEGGRFESTGNATIMGTDLTEFSGLIVDGPSSSAWFGSELRLTLPSGAAVFPGQLVARNGATVEVVSHLKIGNSEGAPSQAIVRAGATLAVGGQIQLALQANGDYGNLDVQDGFVSAEGGLVVGEPAESDRLLVTGPVTMHRFTCSGSPSQSELTGYLTGSSLECGPQFTLWGSGGTLEAPALFAGTLRLRVFTSGAISGVKATEAWSFTSTAKTLVDVTGPQDPPDAALLDVQGDVQLAGKLSMSVASGWWAGPRDSIVVVRAGGELLGDFNSIDPLPTGPAGELLMVVRTDREFRVAVKRPADFNSDGEVDAFDLLTLLGTWGTPGPIGDLDHDGVVGAADLALLLEAWTG